MVTNRKIKYGRYVGAILIAVFFIIGGLVIGNYLAENKSDNLLTSQKAISALLEVSKLKETCTLAANTSYCNLSWGDIWQEKVAIGNILSALETRLGKEDPRVAEQKKVYNDVQFKTLGLVNKVNNQCNYGWDTILFFYTNDENEKIGSSSQSELEGYILDTLYNLNSNVRIFSFDVGVDGDSTETLLKEFNITSIPSVVINGVAYQRFMTRDEIQRVIEK